MSLEKSVRIGIGERGSLEISVVEKSRVVLKITADNGIELGVNLKEADFMELFEGAMEIVLENQEKK